MTYIYIARSNQFRVPTVFSRSCCVFVFSFFLFRLFVVVVVLIARLTGSSVCFSLFQT